MTKNQMTDKSKMDEALDLLSIKIQNFSSKLIGYILPTKIKRGLQGKDKANDKN